MALVAPGVRPSSSTWVFGADSRKPTSCCRSCSSTQVSASFNGRLAARLSAATRNLPPVFFVFCFSIFHRCHFQESRLPQGELALSEQGSSAVAPCRLRAQTCVVVVNQSVTSEETNSFPRSAIVVWPSRRRSWNLADRTLAMRLWCRLGGDGGQSACKRPACRRARERSLCSLWSLVFQACVVERGSVARLSEEPARSVPFENAKLQVRWRYWDSMSGLGSKSRRSFRNGRRVLGATA